jgi:glycosyltransferase involved in cell wall biosynthesis
MNPRLNERFQNMNTGVLVPTFNNAGTLEIILKEIISYTDRVIVINDGSTDSTAHILSKFPDVHTVSYSPNRGKGWALRTGFKKALDLGYTHMISIDSDGQHYPDDLIKFLDAQEKEPNGLVIGKRNMEQAGIPGKSSFGNKFSNFWFWFETGIRLDDTQSGYRLYPIEKLRSIRFYTRKFEFEVEVIVRAAWAGIPISHVDVKVHYDEKDKRISHFRPFRDFSRISVLNTVLVTIALLYIKPRDLLRRASLEASDSNAVKAISVGFGVFMGIAPIWGFQLIAAIALAILFKLNKALVIIAANVSIPPMIPFILFASFKVGGLLMGDEATSLSFNKGLGLADVEQHFVQYIFGAIALAIIAGLLAGLITFILLSTRRRQQV